MRRAANKEPVIVAAGIIRKHGRVLIGQRKSTDRHALKWEFPGGKVEQGESPRAALERELKEELDLMAQIGAEIARYERRIPGRKSLILIFFDVLSFEGDPVSREFEQIQWVTPAELADYDFLDGDRDLVRRLSRQS